MTVPREPARAGIDPHRKLIQRKTDDNLVDVKATTAPVGRVEPLEPGLNSCTERCLASHNNEAGEHCPPTSSARR